MPFQLNIITSNHMENLAADLADLVSRPAGGSDAHPFYTETVMVQSKGMQRWLSMAIAEHNGICANMVFPFPNSFLEKLYAQLVRPLPEANPFDRHVLTFRILSLLPDLLDDTAFTPLRHYLDSARTPVTGYQLANKIADIFDQYAVFRPDVLLQWAAGRDETARLGHDVAWQAIVWQCLTSDMDSVHRPALQTEMVHLLKDPQRPIEAGLLPPRLSVFGISYLPPFHLQVLEALSHRIPVYLFLLNPCREFWFDILSDHQMARIRSRHDDVDEGDLYLERGNRLLASLGHMGKQFFDFIQQYDFMDHFADVDRDTILGCIQGDILDLTDRSASDPGNQPAPARPDGSVRIQCCHSPMREVEVLYDQLLDILSADHRIQPYDILVMTPDINLYAPYIHAVFGTGARQGAAIAYSVADQNILSESKTAECFVKMLSMTGGRFEASRVMELLACPAVRQKFEFSSADLAVVENWVASSGIRWGWDSEDRVHKSLPGTSDNTWRTGLDRLTLGYALAGEEDRLFAGILPFDAIGAGQGHIVGRLVAFAETLHEFVALLSRKADLEVWYERLNRMIDRFFHVDADSERDIQALRDAVALLRSAARFAGGGPDKARPEVPVEVIRAHIKQTLGKTVYDAGFMVGGVTFCAMLPMRSIPARVICLLGMNHDVYPRDQHEPGFNLMTLEPRSGDRSKRNDDRYLFLETLISARDILYLSYVGRDIQDNATIPPSVLLDELLEYISEGFGIAKNDMVIEHPLHGFSPAYFDGSDPRLFSYSEENKAAATQALKRVNARRFFEEPLPPPDEQWRRCQWFQLAAFLSHPVQYLMAQRLGISYSESSITIEDREAFALSPLQRYQVNQHLLKSYLKGLDEPLVYEVARGSGLMPHGTVGKVQFEELSRDVQSYIRTVASYIKDDPPGSIQVRLDLAPYLLEGTIDSLYPDRRIFYRLGQLRPKDMIAAFVYHLALNVTENPDLPRTTTLIGKDLIWHFTPLEKSANILRLYMDYYWQGMHGPIPLFSRTSFEYARQILVLQRSPSEALSAALKNWYGTDFMLGECEDPYLKRAFGNIDVVNDRFAQIALAIFEPLLRSADQFVE